MKLNLKWVTDSIGDDYKKWKKGDIVMINAQTGTGKTTFVKKKLIDNMGSQENMLFICNRVNLKRQLKKDLLKKFEMEIPKSLEELDQITKIENIVITSYHAIAEGELSKIYINEDNNIDHFNYIICDECHFLLADGSFNNKVEIVFNKLVMQNSNNAIKVFISATIERVRECILKSHQENKGWSLANLYEYSSGVDYSYLDTYYFKKMKHIIQLIKNDKTDEKWIIFVTSKKDAYEIQEEISKVHKSQIIMSKSKNEELNEIIKYSRFNSKVLICTKAMDNGVNIEDVKVKNIVIMAWDDITFKQELGRIRVNINDSAKLKLYIPTRSYSSFYSLNRGYESKIALIEEFSNSIKNFNKKYDRDYSKLPSDIFYIENGHWRINLIGYSELYKAHKFTLDIIDEIRSDKMAFVKKQLSWLKLECTFNEDKLIENVADEREVIDLRSYLNNMFENNIRKNKDDFIKDMDNIVKKKLGGSLDEILAKLDNSKKRNKGLKQYNKLFKLLELPYVVGGKRFKINGKFETKWIITMSE